MFRRKSIFVVAAVLATTRAFACAATVTFSYTDGAITYGTAFTNAGGFSGTTGSAPIVGGRVTIPVGDYFEINATVNVTNNANPESGGPYEAASGNIQPPNLGLGTFAMGVLDSSNSIVAPLFRNAVATSGTADTIVFSAALHAGTASAGTIHSNGDIGSGTFEDGIIGGIIAPNVGPGNLGVLTEGAPGGIDSALFTKLVYKVVAPGSATLTPIFNDSQTQVVTVFTPGTADSGPIYINRPLGTGDTLVDNLTPLVINQVPEPTSSAALLIASGFLLHRRRRNTSSRRQQR